MPEMEEILEIICVKSGSSNKEAENLKRQNDLCKLHNKCVEKSGLYLRPLSAIVASSIL